MSANWMGTTESGALPARRVATPREFTLPGGLTSLGHWDAQCTVCSLRNSELPHAQEVLAEIEALWVRGQFGARAVQRAVEPLTEGWPPGEAPTRQAIDRHCRGHLGAEAAWRREEAEGMARMMGADTARLQDTVLSVLGGSEALASEAIRAAQAREIRFRTVSEVIAAMRAPFDVRMWVKGAGAGSASRDLSDAVIAMARAIKDNVGIDEQYRIERRFRELFSGHKEVPEAKLVDGDGREPEPEEERDPRALALTPEYLASIAALSGNGG